jgi:hypothetical protein
MNPISQESGDGSDGIHAGQPETVKAEVEGERPRRLATMLPKKL